MLSRTRYRVSFQLGLLSAVAFAAAGLALQDIHHGGEDLWLEFWVVRISFLVVIAFHAFVIPVLRRLALDLDCATDGGSPDERKVTDHTRG